MPTTSAPSTKPALKKRAKDIEAGVRCRAREHKWSSQQWTKRKSLLIWASISSTVAAASGFITALSGKPHLAWIAGAFAAASAAVTAYERNVDPQHKADEHHKAHNAFEILFSEFRTYIEITLKTASDDDARIQFDTLMDKRARAIESSVGVERRARRAIRKNPSD